MGVGTGGSSKFSNGGLTLPTRGAEIRFSGYYKCKMSPKKVIHFQMGG